MKQKTRLLIDRITEKKPVPEVKAGDGKQQEQCRVFSVESKSAETKGQSVNSRQIAASSWQQDNRQRTTNQQSAISGQTSAKSETQSDKRTTDYRLQTRKQSAWRRAQTVSSRQNAASSKTLWALREVFGEE